VQYIRAQLQYEKRRRRRESHNAVERRRRDNINERIQELSTLVPDCSTDPNNKPNKGAVLRKSVDYIRQMQQMMQQQIRRNQELEAKIAQLQRECGIVTSEASTTASTSETPTTTTTTTTTTTATTTTPASTGLNLMSTAAPGTPMATSVASISTDPVSVTATRSS
jgi:predicted metal-dependent hydrolase